MADLNQFTEYVSSTCSPGSNLPGSYMRALRYLSEMLQAYVPKYADLPPLWEVESLDLIAELYTFVKSEEKRGKQSVFAGASLPPSYFKQRYCSSALKALGRFTSITQRDSQAIAAYNGAQDAGDVARQIEALPVFKPELYIDDDLSVSSKVGKETIREVKQRQNQNIFRKMVLMNYRGTCCVTGMPVRAVLRASHIVGWAEDEITRLLPSNGLCLAATYDAAFDRHLISFDEDYRMILSPSLHEYLTNDAFAHVFKCFEGKRLTPAVKFQPSQEFLQRHREQMS